MTDRQTDTIRALYDDDDDHNDCYRCCCCCCLVQKSMNCKLDPKSTHEASCRLAQQAGGWLAGEIWLKSAGLTSRFKLAFYDIFAGPVAIVGVAQKLHKITNNTVYCL